MTIIRIIIVIIHNILLSFNRKIPYVACNRTICICIYIYIGMQYVRKEDVFNQDMSVKTIWCIKRQLLFFSSPRNIYIYIFISFTIIYPLRLVYLRATITKVRYSRLTFIGTYMYRRGLPTCSLSFILDL